MLAEELVADVVPLPDGELRLLRPRESAELPDDGASEWAPLVPYWSVLWRSGVTLARELGAHDLHDRRVVELGCGLGLPSLTAARGGAQVLATDISSEALELLALNADVNSVHLKTERIDWTTPEALLDSAPFDLVLAADVLYEPSSVAPLRSLLPRLGHEVLLVGPDRSVTGAFLAQADRDWLIETHVRGVVRIHRLWRRSDGSE
jgi:predicted nicotinamide N-methyase